jgi:hypothetical protein
MICSSKEDVWVELDNRKLLIIKIAFAPVVVGDLYGKKIE